MIKDQLKNNEKQTIISSYCQICKIRGHDFLTCNKMHYIPDKDFLRKKLIFYKPNIQRQSFARKKKKSICAFFCKPRFEKLSKIFDFEKIGTFTNRDNFEQVEEEDKDEKNLFLQIETKDLNDYTKKKSIDSRDTPKSHSKQLSYFESESGIKNILNHQFSSQKLSPKNSALFITDFDKVSRFESYFPEQNFENIVTKLENYLHDGRKKGKKKTTILNKANI